MDEREILTRFKAGTLGRDDAARLLNGARQSRTGTPLPPLRPDAAPDSDHGAPDGHGTSADRGMSGGLGASVGQRAFDGRSAADRATSTDPIAVVGIAGRYPLAPDLHAHWDNLLSGRDTSSAVPAARPWLASSAPGRRGHFLDGVADFDPEFHGITPAEGALMDPQERLFLEVAWDALEDAGYTGSRLDALTTESGTSRALGVFVGAASHDYALLAAGAWTPGAGATPRAGHWGLPGRLAASLELTGPAQAVDTAECSGLTAVHLAVGALRRGECAAAVAGGVELLLHPARLADGAGEGVGAVVLKPLHRALADGDRVHAVVRDTASGHLARPRRPESRAAEEAHESRETTARRIGSAGAVTGIAALTDAVLQVRHGVRISGAADTAGVPWPRTRDEAGRELPRTATVEIAAEGGGTAWAVVEEYAAEPGGTDTGGDGGPLLLSAPTPAHLAATAHRLADWLTATAQADADADAGHPAPGPPPAGLARALRVGRAAMPCRIALPAPRDVAELVARLRHFADTGEAGPDAATADLRDGRGDLLGLDGLPETRDYLIALWRAGRTETLTRLWLNGVGVDWAALEAASPWTAPSQPPPPSARLRRPLWVGADRAPADPEPNG
ncbi:beta-ketoacyl synthase N-terminal-like domain-containing protein [Streptomyces sp. NPDC055793]